MRCVLLALGAGLLLATPAAVAQDRKGGMSSKAYPSWAKLCETPTAAGTDLFGRSRAAGIKTCLVFSEQLDAATATRVAAGVQQAEGRQTLLIRVTPDVTREPGVNLMIMPRDIWQTVERTGAPPAGQSHRVTGFKLPYSTCDADGCIAETEATPKLVADLKSNGGLVIVTLKGRHIFAYLVRLKSFREAYDGPSVDTERFLKAREEILRERQRRLKSLPAPEPAPRAKGDQRI
jgi:invasion protein IalB